MSILKKNHYQGGQHWIRMAAGEDKGKQYSPVQPCFDGYHAANDIAPLIVFAQPTSKIFFYVYCIYMIDPDRTKKNSIMRFNLENLIEFQGLS